jgi:hypothetical protein
VRFVSAALAAVMSGLLPYAAHAQSASAPVDVVWNGFAEADVVMSANGRYVAFIESYLHLRIIDRQTRAESVLDSRTLQGLSFWRVFTISDDGRYLTYRVGHSGFSPLYSTYARYDRSSGTVLTLATEASGSRSLVDFPRLRTIAASRDGRTVAWFDVSLPDSSAGPRVMALLPDSDDPTEVGRTCLYQGSLYRSLCTTGPAVTGDGRFILYTAGATEAEALAYYDTTTAARDYYPEAAPAITLGELAPYSTGESGRYVAVRSGGSPDRPRGVFDRVRRVLDPLTEAPGREPHSVSDDGNIVLLEGFPAAIVDRRSGLVMTLPLTLVHALSADGRSVLGTVADAESGAVDLRVVALDADSDGMLDGWERQFGLDPTSAADATADPDGDGVNNGAEFAARSHPTALATATRLFAEGAGGAFFDTQVSVFNPATDVADVVVRFLAPSGTAATRVLRLPAKGRADLASCCLPTLEATEFALVVESTRPIVADRRMTWDRAAGYGSHASAGVAAPATTWYFAEGATVGGLQTFLLLQNPGAVDGVAEIEFLMADGTQTTRSFPVAAGTRQTVWVNQEGGPLASAEFAAVVRSSVPMVAERALYRDASGQVFAAGSNAIGVTAPAERWFFAEGTTRGGFDTFILAANPSDTPISVDATFAGTTDAGTAVDVHRTYTIAPRSRLTIWLDQEAPELADAEISTTLQATAPIVAERAMWWRTGGAEWVEGHVEFGATETGTAFAIADGATVPVASVVPQIADTQTFVLVGIPDAAPATLRVTAYPSAGAPLVREVATTGQRTTIWMAQTFPELTGSYSIVVESLPVNAVATPIVVERAIYSGGFAAGAAARATKLQ